MGSMVKSRSSNAYGSLLRLYPLSFRQHYAVTMQQTFDDMLNGETNKLGRMRVWATTMVDLPLSAGKEHITNGKELSMNRNTKIIIGIVALILLLANAGSFWFGNLHARNSIGVEKVTVSQLADAMQQDDFYSTYGNTAVLFSGKVESVTTQGNAALATFNTGRPYSLTCQFASAISLKQGDVVSIAAPAGSAERQPHGVFLHNCLRN